MSVPKGHKSGCNCFACKAHRKTEAHQDRLQEIAKHHPACDCNDCVTFSGSDAVRRNLGLPQRCKCNHCKGTQVHPAGVALYYGDQKPTTKPAKASNLEERVTDLELWFKKLDQHTASERLKITDRLDKLEKRLDDCQVEAVSNGHVLAVKNIGKLDTKVAELTIKVDTLKRNADPKKPHVDQQHADPHSPPVDFCGCPHCVKKRDKIAQEINYNFKSKLTAIERHRRDVMQEASAIANKCDGNPFYCTCVEHQYAREAMGLKRINATPKETLQQVAIVLSLQTMPLTKAHNDIATKGAANTVQQMADSVFMKDILAAKTDMNTLSRRIFGLIPAKDGNEPSGEDYRSPVGTGKVAEAPEAEKSPEDANQELSAKERINRALTELTAARDKYFNDCLKPTFNDLTLSRNHRDNLQAAKLSLNDAFGFVLKVKQELDKAQEKMDKRNKDFRTIQDGGYLEDSSPELWGIEKTSDDGLVDNYPNKDYPIKGCNCNYCAQYRLLHPEENK